MDLISHGLWGIAITNKKVNPILAFFSGSLPDLVSSGLGFVYLLIYKGVFWSTNTWSLLPLWIQTLYYFSHSLLGAITFFIIITIFRWPKILLLPYLFHLFLDVFTHAGSPINRLVFPLEINSTFHVTTNWWDNYWLIIINWALLLILLFWQNKRPSGQA